MSESQKKSSAPVIEVLELEDALLDLASGGYQNSASLNIDCDTTNSGCNTVAGCGGGK